MTERSHPTPPPERDPTGWDAEKIAETLGTSAEPRLDALHGQGLRYRLGEPPGTELELFPAARTIRLTSPELQLHLAEQDAPHLAPEGVIFETPHRLLVVTPAGAVTLRAEPVPAAPPRTAQDAPDVAERPNTSQQAGEPLPDDSTAPQDIPQIVSATRAPEQPEQERVTLAGRLGTDIRYRTTRNGKLIAAFPLAIKQDDGTTRWQDVLLFGERAAKLRAGTPPKRGHYTEVIGYVHHRTITGKDGSHRTVTEIYAVALRPE